MAARKEIATTKSQGLMATLAAKFNVPEAEMLATLKQTAFKGEKEASDAQMTALLIVADQYGLNPWTKEIYAFPDPHKGIVPVVGVDGWLRIINENPSFDGMEFEQDDQQCTCRIYRKDRSRPVEITEYHSECVRATGPWKSHPRRMLRHKALIQCARVAFAFVGIYDEDEAERMVERDITPPSTAPQAKPQQQAESDGLADNGPIEGDAVQLINEQQARLIRNKMLAKKIEEARICQAFEIAAIELLPFSVLNNALEWIQGED